MIAIKEGAVTRLVREDTRVIDIINANERGLAYRRIPSARLNAKYDKPLTLQDARNERRNVSYTERKRGTKPPHLEIWSV